VKEAAISRRVFSLNCKKKNGLKNDVRNELSGVDEDAVDKLGL
jgi:hypothetical protein